MFVTRLLSQGFSVMLENFYGTLFIGNRILSKE